MTSQRTSESLSDVPISVEVFTEEQMEAQGIKQFDDIVRFTPGLALNPGNGGGNNISIRGISSQAGASTTGVYIDDTPIQVRQVGYAAGTVFPVVFDLERVEVLRGPQGTIFGAGSEGGTVRFIQPAPSVDEYSGTVRAEGSTIEHGGDSYEAGGAFGGPLIAGKLGFRLSAFYREEGGYLDAAPATFAVNDPTGSSYGNSITVTPSGPIEKDVNSQDSLALRAALKWVVSDNLTITPSLYYQEQNLDETADAFWLSGSDPDAGRFFIPKFIAGPVTPGGFTQLHLPADDTGSTQLELASVSAQWDLGAVSLFSSTSYLDQQKQQITDQTLYYAVSSINPALSVPSPGQEARNDYSDSMKTFTQELRIQSTDPTARIRWIAGVFYSRSRQLSHQYTENNIYASATEFFGFPVPSDGSPFGPGFSSYENTWGTPLINDSGTYFADTRTTEEQSAIFGQTEVQLSERVALIAGVRVSRNTLDYSLVGGGAENNLNLPFGAECPTGPTCPFGSGVFTPAFPSGEVKNTENAVTPKVGINFQVTDDHLLYASATKGFRPGGAQIQLPEGCSQDLLDFGYVDANGNPATPPTYDSDSVWSYEIGTKNRLREGRVNLSASAYQIKWKNIQQNIAMPICGYALIDNVGSATVRGFDANAGALLGESLTLNASVAYTDTELDDGLYQPSGAAVYPSGSSIVDAGPPWNIAVSAQYDFAAFADFDGYFRTDYTHTSTWYSSGRANAEAFNYDPLLGREEETDTVNARVGLKRLSLDVSLFVNNLLDSTPLIRRTHSVTVPAVWTARTLRPRTVGLTLSYRF